MRLDPRVRLHIDYDDATPFGSAVSQRCDELLRSACPEIVERWNAQGIGEVVRHGETLLASALARKTGLGAYFVATDRLHADFLRPDPRKVTPAALVVARTAHSAPTTSPSLSVKDDAFSTEEVSETEETHETGDRNAKDLEAPTDVARVPLSSGLASELATLIGAWHVRAEAPPSGAARHLFDRLRDLGCFTSELARSAGPTGPAPGDLTFIGHASVCFSTSEGSILVDPWLLPPGREAGGLAPLQLDDLGPVRLVLLTHAHPDHYDLGTLLRLGPDVPIVVPMLAEETVLAIDLGLRLRELGFREVTSAAWGDRIEVGAGVAVEILPFYGEQPALDAVLHPEVRNAGNTYVIEAAGGRFALVADSGRDPLGSIRDVARASRDLGNRIDWLFAGCRGFALYPVHYLFSSVARYLPFVPRSDFGVRQRIMNDADDALDVGELWGAERLVPYADGGAPWYWRLGLGPVLDGSRRPVASVDPAPEHVVLAARQRSGSSRGPIASWVEVEVMRPGDRWMRLASEADRTGPASAAGSCPAPGRHTAGATPLRAPQGSPEACWCRIRPVPWPFPPIPGLGEASGVPEPRG